MHFFTGRWKAMAAVAGLVLVGVLPPPVRPAAAASGACPRLDAVSFGEISPSATYWIRHFADHAGVWQRHCIKLQAVMIPSSTALSAAAASRSIDVAAPTTDTAITAREAGASIAIVASAQNIQIAGLVTRPEIRGYQDLRGKEIGMAGVTTGTSLLLARLLAQNGLKGGEYTFIEGGGTAERYAALQAGAYPATWLNPPQDLQAQAKGYRILGRINEAVPEYQYTSLAVNVTWARQNADLLVHFLQAWTDSAAMLYDPQNRALAERVLVEDTGVSPSVAAATYDLMILKTKALPQNGFINVKGMFVLLEIMKELNQIKAIPGDLKKYVDASYWAMATGRPEPALSR